MTARLRPARPDECEMLGDIALAAKGHWAYGKEFLETCRVELTVSAGDLPDVVVAERCGDVLGWYRLVGSQPQGELEHLWVRPDAIGTGLGRLMWSDVVRSAEERLLHSFVIEADPHAEGFYLAMGAHRVGVVRSRSVGGRDLPLLRFVVVEDPQR